MLKQWFVLLQIELNEPLHSIQKIKVQKTFLRHNRFFSTRSLTLFAIVFNGVHTDFFKMSSSFFIAFSPKNPKSTIQAAIIILKHILMDDQLCWKIFVAQCLHKTFVSNLNRKKKKEKKNCFTNRNENVSLLQLLLHVCREFVNIFISIASTNYRIWWDG